MSDPQLTRTARDVFKLTPKDRLSYNTLIGFYRLTGLWRYPIEASGDLETMRRMDIVYWLYKTTHPIANPVRNSGLEEYFDNHGTFEWVQPAGFEPTAELSLSAVGDLMDHPFLQNSADTLYTGVADTIFGADVSMANLECVPYPQRTGELTFSPCAGPSLCYNARSFAVIKGYRDRLFSFMAAATNHSLDFGEAGVESTIRTLTAEGIAFNGVNQTEAAATRATLLETNGFKLALVSHTFGLNGKRPPESRHWLVNRTNLNARLRDVDLGMLERQIGFCRDNDVDASIVHLHWGVEHKFYPRPDQLELAHHLAEMGFDIVIGHHPHVVQPVEFYRTRRDPQRVVPIYYSLGTLVNPFSAPYLCRSGVARITLARGICREGVSRAYVTRARQVDVFQQADHSTKKLQLVVLPRLRGNTSGMPRPSGSFPDFGRKVRERLVGPGGSLTLRSVSGIVDDLHLRPPQRRTIMALNLRQALRSTTSVFSLPRRQSFISWVQIVSSLRNASRVHASRLFRDFGDSQTGN